MAFQKFSPYLALSILVLCQAGNFQAVPFRSSLESSPDPSTLAHPLLAASLKGFEWMKASELQQNIESSSVTAQKTACNTVTCVTHRLAGLLSRSGGMVKTKVLPSNMGSETFT
ncbi:calcitonin gene-related peptide 2-like [Orycteropus afer afer]|uniref:Calcitonin gene-related peptide 2-like n=1 Tax=Orycteropus afer afer TaxID=1230840 RepID=A0AC54Z637_ORYAF|nr:calcitonin gene-related peptide 2-like [Orycteropus afer afer]